MDDKTKEWVQALIAGFAKVVSDNAKNTVTRTELHTELNKMREDIRKDWQKDMKEEMNKQTERVIKVINEYKKKTERHEKLLSNIKGVFDKE